MTSRRPLRAPLRALLLSLAASLVAATAPSAQTQAPHGLSAEGRKALEPYLVLVGDWEGPATLTGNGRSMPLRQTEEVRTGAGGATIVVHGRGTMATPQGEREVYTAFAVIWWEPTASQVRMRAWLSDGRAIEVEPSARDGTVTWGFRDPAGGEIRYTVTGLAEGTWHEIGERRVGEGAWTRFLEMTLKKKP